MKLPDGELPARALVLDRELIRTLYDLRTQHGNSPHDEMWAGTLVLYTPPDNEHQWLRTLITCAFCEAVQGVVLSGANVASEESGWLNDFRCPDVVVYMDTNQAKHCGTHWVGGPDLAIEIVSPGEEPGLKLDFYAKVHTREVLIVDRYPWSIEMYQLQAGKLMLVGTSDLASSAVLPSGALPLTFQLQTGTTRPNIVISHTSSGQTWTA